MPDYLDACAGVVLDRPNRPAADHPWTENDVEQVSEAISEFPWLERYKSVEPPTPQPSGQPADREGAPDAASEPAQDQS
jgi:hypothetical protein